MPYAEEGPGQFAEAKDCETLTPIGKLTVRGRLDADRDKLRAKLADLDAAITALDANPEIERVLSLVGKVLRY